MNERHARRLLTSYQRWTGQELMIPKASAPLLQQLDEADFVILSHGVEADPILNFGNLKALQLWEMDIEQFTKTPSRLTAEPMEREQRAAFLAKVSANGYVDNYTGVRISATGRRFYIVDAVVWNVVDEDGQYIGQAATFRHITPIDE